MKSIVGKVFARRWPIDHPYYFNPSFIIVVPDKEAGSYLDPELPGTGLWTEGGEGPGPPNSGEKSKLEPSRDGGNMRRNGGEPILDVMKEDQPKE
jgi:hypothetical protein